MAVRSIVKIDEDLCTGCGVCVTPCAEGAIEIIDGKAKVMKEELCDGAGFCLAVCPEGALTVEKRDAPEFDEDAAAEKIAEKLAASVTIDAEVHELRPQRERRRSCSPPAPRARAPGSASSACRSSSTAEARPTLTGAGRKASAPS